jgi:hypothetical protein
MRPIVSLAKSFFKSAIRGQHRTLNTDVLQEFVDARRRAIQNAPQVLFRNDPPLELQGFSGLPSGKGEVGYITFGKSSLATLMSFC